MFCLPCNLLDSLPVLVGREAAEQCPCKFALVLLTRLGAVHTARMHANGAAEHPDRWSERDWLLHMEEEKNLFFPLLPKDVSAQFLREHAQFQQELLDHGKIVSVNLLQAHSDRENLWAEKILRDREAAQAQNPQPAQAKVSGLARMGQALTPKISSALVVIVVGIGILVTGALTLNKKGVL